MQVRTKHGPGSEKESMDPWSIFCPYPLDAAVELGHSVNGLLEKYLRRTESALRLPSENNTETNPEHLMIVQKYQGLKVKDLCFRE